MQGKPYLTKYVMALVVLEAIKQWYFLFHFQMFKGAGHHVYADASTEFNAYVNKIMNTCDNGVFVSDNTTEE